MSGFTDGTHTFTFHSADNASNVESTQTYTFTVDTTAPTVTMTVSPATPDGANGWYLTNPTVSMTASDTTSGIASRELQFEGESDWLPYSGPFQVCGFTIPGKPPVGCKYPPPPPPWGDGHKIDVRATDQAGNTGSDSRVLKVDLDVPVTTASLSPAIHNGWYASPTLTLTGSDGHSGIAHTDYALDGGTWHTYSGPISGFTTGNHFVQYASTDNAGRLEAVKLIAFKVDAVKPSVTITRPAEGDSFPLDKVVTAAFKCADKESGMDTCVGTVANGANLDTSTIGPHAFTVTGTDLAGNVTTVTHHYTVTYTFNGFFQPISNESDQQLNLVHAGDLIKVGFGLNGNQGATPGTVTSSTVACPSWAPHSVSAGGQGTTAGFSFGVASGHYTYGWLTSSTWAGSCRQFKLTLNDGSVHTAVFMFFA